MSKWFLYLAAVLVSAGQYFVNGVAAGSILAVWFLFMILITWNRK